MKLSIILKLIFALIITLIPNNKIRVLFLNIIPGYRFANSNIGYVNLFCVASIDVFNSNIGNFNFFYISKLKMENNSILGSKNIFFSYDYLKSKLIMFKSQISFKNYFEFNEEVYLGENVVFGGCCTKMILGPRKDKTILSKNIFIGSNSLLMSGIKISENITIGAGSIVQEDLNLVGIYYSKEMTSAQV
jgi:acetyltransferase-like isoleucine patch superfamily enzyme